MNKIGKLLLFLLVLSGVFGCSSTGTKDMDEKYLSVSAEYKGNGFLDIHGEYDEWFWGLDNIRGKYEGKDTIILSAVASRSGEDEIFHRMQIPATVNRVKFGSVVLWDRNEAVEKILEKKEEVAALPQVKSGKKSEPEKTVSKEDRDRQEVVSPAGKRITYLKIGSEKITAFTPQNLDFEEIFWGRISAIIPGKPQTLECENIAFSPEFNADLINKFADLEILEIRGTVSAQSADFSTLKLPKLKKLIVDRMEISGLEKAEIPHLEEFYLNDTRLVPLGKTALPEKLEHLHTVGIQAFAGNFDFDSLAGKPLKSLRIHGDCSSFEFLRNMPLEFLQLSGFYTESAALNILHSLPLKTLILKPLRRLSDWRFLAGIKPEILDITCLTAGNFSPELLKDMPLKILRLSCIGDFGDAWMSCKDMPLTEFVLRNGTVPENFLLSKHIERLALFQNCRWNTSEPINFLNKLHGIKHLAVWQGVEVKNGKPVGMIDPKLNWNRYRGWTVESLAVSTVNLDFIRNLPKLKRLAVRESSTYTGKHGIAFGALKNRDFDVVIFPAALKQHTEREMLRRNIKVKNPDAVDMIRAFR